MQEKSILEMARGAILERADYEMKKILDNISDINTNPTKKRTLTLQIEFEPNENRERISIKAVAKSKLEPTNPIRTSLFTAIDNNGEVFIAENTPQIPGQVSMDGFEQEEPVVLKIVKGA